jgi:SAM-dependent methyltransferase
MTPPPCPICAAATAPCGSKRGVRTDRVFHLRRCGDCGFAFVEDPWTEYDQIYDQAYYEGRGSDPLINYAREFDDPETSVRAYEWRGWDRLVHAESPGPVKWLDFGSGCGTLVRHLRQIGRDEVYGFDTGAWSERARNRHVPILTEAELSAHAGSFDVVTAVDVVEHLVDPLSALRLCRRMLKPGGRLIPVTQNALIAPREFVRWSYVLPEIHVSFFTPDALARALRQTGFTPGPFPHNAGQRAILRARILKNLGVHRRNWGERLMPWPFLSRLAEARYQMARMPIGIAT